MSQKSQHRCLVSPGPAGLIAVAWDRKIDVGQQTSREAQTQLQHRAPGEFLHQSTGCCMTMFILVDSSWNFKNTSRKTSTMFTQRWSLNLYEVTTEYYVKLSDYQGLLENCSAWTPLHGRWNLSEANNFSEDP